MKLDTAEGEALAFDRAVYDLTDPSYAVLGDALKVIIAGRIAASGTAVTAAVSAIHSLMMDPSFRRRSLVNDDGKNYTEGDCWKALATLGPAARQTLPLMRQRMEDTWSSFFDRRDLLQCMAAISPEDALAYCSRSLEEEGKNGDFERINNVLQVAFSLGKTAIPTLEQFCGAFSGSRGRWCKEAVAALRNNQERLSLSWP